MQTSSIVLIDSEKDQKRRFFLRIKSHRVLLSFFFVTAVTKRLVEVTQTRTFAETVGANQSTRHVTLTRRLT